MPNFIRMLTASAYTVRESEATDTKSGEPVDAKSVVFVGAGATAAAMLRVVHYHSCSFEVRLIEECKPDLPDEFDLGHRALGELHIGRRILEKHSAAQKRLGFIDVIAHPVQRFLDVGHRQQIIQIGA